jgi:O-antigen/teichoic acid export membrane protein
MPMNTPPAEHRLPSRKALLWPVRHLSNYALLVGGTGVARLLSLATAVVLARELGPVKFGEASIFLVILGFWGSADFIDSTYVRYASDTLEAGERASYLRALFGLKIAWNLVLLILAAPLAWLLSSFAFHKPVLMTAILCSILCGVGLNFMSLRAARFQARERFLPFTILPAVFYLLSFVLVVATLLVTGTENTFPIYMSFLAATLVIGAYSCASTWRHVRPLTIDGDLIKRLVKFCRWLFGANLTYMFSQRLDVFLLAAFVPLAVIGQYGVALRIVTIVSLLTGTMAPILLPRASRTHQDPKLMASYLRHAAALSGMIILLVVILWVGAPGIVSVVFGSRYTSAVGIVRILLLGTIAIALYTPLSQLFLTEAEPRRMLYLSLLRVAMLTALGLILIPPLGGKGAAIAVGGTEMSALVYVVIALRRQIRSVVNGGHGTSAIYVGVPSSGTTGVSQG